MSLIYLVQGLTDLAWLAEKYFLKDELGAAPAQVSLLLSLASVPWLAKPLLGFISDAVPLLGYRRRSYLLLASAAAAASWLYLSCCASSLSSTLWALVVGSSAVALSDVVVDSVIVERAREERPEAAGGLQSACWAAYAAGQVATAALSGSLVEVHGPRFVFAITSAFPVLIGVASLMVHEEPAGGLTRGGGAAGGGGEAAATAAPALKAPAPVPVAGVESVTYSGPAPQLGPPGSAIPPLGAPEVRCDSASGGSGSTSSIRTPSCSSSSTSGPPTVLLPGRSLMSPPAVVPPPHPPTSPGWRSLAGGPRPGGLQALSTAVAAAKVTARSARARLATHGSDLWTALSAPAIAWPVAFLVLLSATPAADDAVFYWQVEELGFSPSFLGGVQLAIAVASLAGVWLYNAAFKSVPLRSFLFWGNLLGAGLQCSDLLLVSRANTWLGLDDHLFVVGGSVVTCAVANVLAMPTMVLAARLCPRGLEATMFATIMSLLNAADGVRYASGAALMEALGVGAGSYDNLPLLVGLCTLALLLPLPVLLRLPRHQDCEELAAEASAWDADAVSERAAMAVVSEAVMQGAAGGEAVMQGAAGGEAAPAAGWGPAAAAVVDEEARRGVRSATGTVEWVAVVAGAAAVTEGGDVGEHVGPAQLASSEAGGGGQIRVEAAATTAAGPPAWISTAPRPPAHLRRRQLHSAEAHPPSPGLLRRQRPGPAVPHPPAAEARRRDGAHGLGAHARDGARCLWPPPLPGVEPPGRHPASRALEGDGTRVPGGRPPHAASPAVQPPWELTQLLLQHPLLLPPPRPPPAAVPVAIAVPIVMAARPELRPTPTEVMPSEAALGVGPGPRPGGGAGPQEPQPPALAGGQPGDHEGPAGGVPGVPTGCLGGARGEWAALRSESGGFQAASGVSADAFASAHPPRSGEGEGEGAPRAPRSGA